MIINYKKLNYKKILIALIIIFILRFLILISFPPLVKSFFIAISNNNIGLMNIELFIWPELSNWELACMKPLNMAVSLGNVESVKILIKYKANVNDKSKWSHSCTALYEASGINNNEIMTILLKNGADPNIESSYGSYPIYQSILYKNFDMVDLLIKYGADLNIQDTDGKSPLFYSAIECQDKDMTELLLRNGADPSIRDNDNKTVKDYLVEERVKANDKEKIRIHRMIKLIEKYEKPQKK